MISHKKEFSLAELTKDLDVSIKGDPDIIITGICPIQQSTKGHITFLNNSNYKKYLTGTEASAIILSEELADQCHVNAVISRDPYYTYAKIAEFFAENLHHKAHIHPSAVIGENCIIHPSVIIGPNVVIGDHVEIGADTKIDALVSIYSKVKIGERCHISSGVVIGGDGFGFANYKGAWHKVPQLGSVVIGDDVSIGANTSIDRGAIEDTLIENGVKLDNLIQVAHNVRIGENTIIAGCVAIAGSVDIGKNCMIGGGSCFAGHISLCDGTMITGMTAVTKSITEPGIYSSGIVGAVPNHEFRKNNARFHRLENLMQKVKQLETEVKMLKESKTS